MPLLLSPYGKIRHVCLLKQFEIINDFWVTPAAGHSTTLDRSVPRKPRPLGGVKGHNIIINHCREASRCAWGASLRGCEKIKVPTKISPGPQEGFRRENHPERAKDKGDQFFRGQVGWMPRLVGGEGSRLCNHIYIFRKPRPVGGELHTF